MRKNLAPKKCSSRERQALPFLVAAGARHLLASDFVSVRTSDPRISHIRESERKPPSACAAAVVCGVVRLSTLLSRLLVTSKRCDDRTTCGC